MLDQFARTQLLLGAEGLQRLKEARVIVFGIGGVGAFAAEALVRSGIGAIDLVDDDKLCLTNLNRQLIATRKTVGSVKVNVMRDRLLEINPQCTVTAHETFYNADTADRFDMTVYSYVLDAIDTVSAKLLLIERCQAAGTPIISCMGAGNKLDPTRFTIADIYETSVCPLAKVMRNELRKRGIQKLKVVYSQEPPLKPIEDDSVSCKHHCVCPPGTQRNCSIRRQVPGSIAFVPSVAGLIQAGEVIKDIAFARIPLPNTSRTETPLCNTKL
ncbi:MAG: tRNA threonylcarbamoyladenosine dehydratase [Oscillospiraceae bacterium]|jgi:tRNA A37 threonylcarbamoyladenosine dehydratase|nr:tRNA threonylcarbamoyladenosine dehydratase [Oscillospiraceae bacterium]